MYYVQTSKLTIRSEQEIPWTLDGEFGGNHKEVTVINQKQGIGIYRNMDISQDVKDSTECKKEVGAKVRVQLLFIYT